uniref:Transposase (Putative), gypsy type n=1 Tax=Tanacetum cinerariifolium TaxID=118510 RepID=A0A6L2K6H6_TANCI|nr:hypothetical protein [Tanacetum cinerariifolium]
MSLIEVRAEVQMVLKHEYFFVLPKLDEFISSYSIPSEYRVILPTPTQTILDAPPGYIGLYTHFFSLANLRLPLNDLFCELLLKEIMLDVKSFKDKLPSGIEQNLQFQRLARYPVSARAFDDPILFLAGLQPSWEHGQQLPAIFLGGKEMSFRNFIYTEDDEDLTFLPKDFSLDLGGSPKGDTFVHARSVAARIRKRQCKTRGGSLRPLVKRNLASGSSTSRTVRTKVSPIKDDTPVLSIFDDDEDAIACHLKIFAITPLAWKGFLDNHRDVDLLDLHDRCYARQAVMDNALNRRSRKLLEVIEKLRGEVDVMRARKLAYEEEYEGLRSKYDAALTDFDKNPVFLLLREKMSSLAAEVKEHKGNLNKLMLESQMSGYQEIKEVKHDRREVISKVVPYACMELLHSDELGRLVGKLVSSAITFGRCRAYEQVARMKELFDLLKVKRYRPSYEKEHTQVINDLATATFSWLNEYVADASASVEAFLSKNPPLYKSMFLRGPRCMCLLTS